MGARCVLVNHPIRYDGQVPELRIKGYAVGEHTREILAENGYSKAQIEDLFARGVVAGPTNNGSGADKQTSGTVAA